MRYCLLFAILFLLQSLILGYEFWSIGTANNAGAILVLGRDLVVVPKLIHPLPPAITSPETSPERHIEDTWMQVLFSSDMVQLFLLYVFILIINLLVLFDIRSSMQIDHQHQPEAAPKWPMIEVLLLGYSPRASLNCIPLLFHRRVQPTMVSCTWYLHKRIGQEVEMKG